MLKYLRIAVTALMLTACVLLAWLWARRFWWCDGGYSQIGGIRYDVTSLRGCIAVGWQKDVRTRPVNRSPLPALV